MLNVYAASRCHEIPEEAGVYSFYYNPFQKRGLGLFRGRENNPESVANARKVLIRKQRKLQHLLQEYSADGEIKLRSPAGNLFAMYSGSMSRRASSPISEKYHSMSDEAFINFVDMAEKAAVMFQPLYCGMTVSQGLRARFLQHKSDHDLKRSGSFGGRLSAYGINWDDLVFECIPVRADDDYSSSVIELERQLINLTDPILNVKKGAS